MTTALPNGSSYLCCDRSEALAQDTECPVTSLELEEEVWFYSGYGCQIYLKSSHKSSLLSSLLMAIFIILCPDVSKMVAVSMEELEWSRLRLGRGLTYLMAR